MRPKKSTHNKNMSVNATKEKLRLEIADLNTESLPTSYLGQP